MSGEAQSISIDWDVLHRSAQVLHRAAEGLAEVSHAIASAPVGASAFGLMNAWMVAPIHSVASNSVELLRVSGNVVEVVAAATDDASKDFESAEHDVLAWVEKLDADLGAASAPVPPPVQVQAQPTPMPTPSPSPNPTPTPNGGEGGW